MNSSCSNAIFPNEILEMILIHLSFRDLLEAAVVSRQFYQVVISSRLFRKSTLYLSESGIVSHTIHYLPQNQGIGLCHMNLSRIALPLSNVLRLNSSKSDISPISLSLFASYLPSLMSLDLSFTNISDQSLEAFVEACPLVEHVNLTGCLVLTPDSWIRLSSWKGLKNLNVSHTRMATMDGILLFAQTHPDLRELKLNCCVYIRCEQEWIRLMLSLFKCCKKLSLLDISHNILVSAQVLEPIYELMYTNTLFTLDIRNCEQITVSDINRLKSKFPKIQIYENAIIKDYTPKGIREYIEFLTTY